MDGRTYKHRSIVLSQNALCKEVCEGATVPMHTMKVHWMSDRS